MLCETKLETQLRKLQENIQIAVCAPDLQKKEGYFKTDFG
jgi:hypothetical protein